jgi:preprotein translocase subunit SecE
MAEVNKKPSRFARIKKWFREMRSELKKVVWPTGSQILNNTLVVVACVVIVGIIVFALDTVANFALDQFLKLV